MICEWLLKSSSLRGVVVALQELKDVLATVPEILELVGYEELSKIMNDQEHDGHIEPKSFLQSIFTRLMSAKQEAVSEAVLKLKSRLNSDNKVVAINVS